MTVQTYTYPVSSRLETYAKVFLDKFEESRVIRDLFPVRDIDAAEYLWEQLDIVTGLQQARGYGGPPQRVKPIGHIRGLVQPGVYGEYAEIEEREMTTRREYGTYADPISLNVPVLERSNQLLTREVNLRESICWNLLANGYYIVTNDVGAVIDIRSYSQRIYAATTPWSTLATATPFYDMRQIKLLARGFSVNFGRQAVAYANQSTINNLIENTNTADLGGKRRIYGETVNDLAAVNRIFLDNDIPAIEPFDEGYYDLNNTFQLFIPNGIVIVRGVRPMNEPIGEFFMTRNINSANGMGRYLKVIDTFDREVPRCINVHRGYNGGPNIRYPSAIVVIKV